MSVFAARVKTTLIWCLCFVVIIAVLEILARMFCLVSPALNTDIENLQKTYAEQQRQSVWYHYSPTLGWDIASGYQGELYRSVREFDQTGLLSVDADQLQDRQKSQQNSKTIVFLGDSVTFGYGVATAQTFIEQLDQQLPGSRLINLAVPGYSSWQGLQIFREKGVSLEPDIVVIAFHFNDRRYVTELSRQDSAEHFEQIYHYTRWRAYLESLQSSYLYLCALILAGEGGEKQTVRLDTLLPRVSEQRYRDNLQVLISEVRGVGAEPVLLLLPDNPFHAIYYGEEQLNLVRTQPQFVAEALAENIHENPHNWFNALTRLQLAELYQRQNNAVPLDELLTVELYNSVHGGYPIVADYPYHRAANALAAKEGVAVIDMRLALNVSADHYLDFAHLSVAGHKVVAQQLNSQLSAIEKSGR